MSSKDHKDLPLPGANFVVDGYLGGPRTIITNQHHVNLFSGPERLAFLDDDNNKDDSGIHVTNLKATKKPAKSSTSALMKEYNQSYSGLTILPWADFVKNPRKLNDLFHLEKTGFITYDPDEVNVFFHAKRMEKPTLGDVGESGKSWVINVEKPKDFERIRTSLLEKVSVFGLTLLRSDNKVRGGRVPCLLMLDPSYGTIADQIQSYMMRCLNISQNNGNFTLEINFNGCVERWCRRITNAKCKSIGARLTITNGEEQDALASMENIICCIACFPIWLIQTAVYKIHRKITYQDIELDFSAEEVLLYGSVGGVQNQRDMIFNGRGESGVFYTVPTAPPPEDVGQKYVSKKRHSEEEENDDNKVYDFGKTPLQALNGNRNDNIVRKTEHHQNKEKPATGESSSSESDNNVMDISKRRRINLSKQQKSGTAKPNDTVDLDDEIDTRTQMPTKINKNKLDNDTEISTFAKQTLSDDVFEQDAIQTLTKKNDEVRLDEHVDDNAVQSLRVENPQGKRVLLRPNSFEIQKNKTNATVEGFENAGYESDDIDSESQVEYLHPSPMKTKQTSTTQQKIQINPNTSGLMASNRLDKNVGKIGTLDKYSRNNAYRSYGNNINIGASPSLSRKTEQNDSSGVINNAKQDVNTGDIPSGVQSFQSDTDGSLFTENASFKHRRMLSQGMIGGNEIESLKSQSNENITNIIPVSKTEQTCQLDTTNPEYTDMETDMDLSDLETDSDHSTDNSPENLQNKTNGPTTRITSARRRQPRYDSRRKYLSAQLPRKKIISPINRPQTERNYLR